MFGSRTDNGDPAGAEGDSIVAQVFTDLAERVEHGPGGREEKK